MRPDMNGAFDEFDDMVEALEEHEDIVECKECFELFPKADCMKHNQGYMCPTCNRAFEARPEFDSRTLTTDLYDQDFPEITDYAPETVKDWEAEPTVNDALDALLVDEYDAVDGYEVADETIQRSNVSEAEKDKILDTLDHIKEEEEEHIDELKELTSEDVLDEEDEEDEIDESLDLVEDTNLPIYYAEDLETGDIIAACRASSETEAFEILEVAFRERTGKTGSELEDCYITIADDSVDSQSLTDPEILVEDINGKETLTEGPRRLLKNLGQKAGNLAKHIANKDSGKIIDQFFNEGYILWFTPKNGVKEKPPVWKDDNTGENAGHKQIFDTLDQAVTAARNYSDEYRSFIVKIFARPIDTSDLSPKAKKIADVEGDFGALIASFSNNAASVNKASKIADDLSELMINQKDLLKTTGNSVRGANQKNKPDPEEEEEETSEEDEQLEDEEDESLEDEENPIETLRKKALELLGEKRDPADYTAESYAKYSPLYDKALKAIQGAKKKETFEQTYIPALPGLVKKWDDTVLVKKSSDPKSEDPEDVDDIPEDEDDLDAVKKAAREALGEKLAAEGYTSESYEAYSKKFDAAVKFIDKQTDAETLKKYDFAKLKAKYEALLEKEVSDIPEDPEDPEEETGEEVERSEEDPGEDPEEDVEEEPKGDPKEEPKEDPEESEEEPEEKPEEESEEEPALKGKLSELTDVQLAKLFSAASGKAVGYANAEKTKLSDKWHKEMNKIRRKLQGLGESFGTEDEIIEKLKEALRESEEIPEDEVECTWCHDTFPKSACRYEVDLDWLCSRCEMGLKSRGETLTFKENNYWDFLDEDIKDTNTALAELDDTSKNLKNAATGIKNMTQAMHEDSHK